MDCSDGEENGLSWVRDWHVSISVRDINGLPDTIILKGAFMCTFM